MKESLLVLFVLSGLLMIGAAIPLILQKIPPNWIYGFRVRATMENPDVWYPANRYAGWAMLVAGILTIVAAAALYFIPGLGGEDYATAVTIVLMAALLGATAASFWYLRTIVSK